MAHLPNFLVIRKFLSLLQSDHGNLNFVDTSTGRPITEHRTKMGSLRCMTHNPHNGIVHLGHQNGRTRPLHTHTRTPPTHTGTVTLWSPNMHTSLVKLLCHQGPLTAVAIETGGWYMATAGMDAKLKIWDIRNYKLVNPTTINVACSIIIVVQYSCLGLYTM